MAEYKIQDTTLTSIADAIRVKTGEDGAMSPTDMAGKIVSIKVGGEQFPNGTEWTSFYSNWICRDVRYANGIWVAVGETYIRYSTTGKSWNTAVNNSNYSFENIHYNDGVWVATGSGYFAMMYSTDGKNWTAPTSAAFNNRYGCKTYYANGIWLTVQSASGTNLYYSESGKSWTKSDMPASCEFVQYAGGIWFAFGKNRDMYYSTNGKNWTMSTLSPSTAPGLHYANGIWVAVSYRSTGSYTGVGTVCYSTDGANWTESNLSYEYGGGRGTNYANKVWVIGFGDGLYYSADGMSWTKSNVTMSYGVTSGTSYYLNGIWYWVNGGNVLYYSTDGMSWSKVSIGGDSFYTIHYDDGIWILGGMNNIYYSTDGINWTTSNAYKESSTRKVLRHNNGIWIAAGYGSCYSVTWEPPT